MVESNTTIRRLRAAIVDPAAGRAAVEDFNLQRDRLADEFAKLLRLVARDLFEGRFDGAAEIARADIAREATLPPAEKNLLLNLARYVEDLRASRFLVGVVGRFKSGKSTLLNTLAEHDCSPVNTRVTTGVLTFTARAEKARTAVRYLDGHEEEIRPDQVPLFVDERFNPDNERGVESVSVESPGLDLPEEMTYVDTPGLQAVNEIHEKITLEFVRYLSAAIVVSEYPPFGLEELRFYERLKESVAHIFLVQNLPADKFNDWVTLECQTIGNVLRLGLWTGGNLPEPQRKTIAASLRRIGDARDVAALERAKEDLGLKLWSLDAKTAQDAIAGLRVKPDPARAGELQARLEASRFPRFKQALYQYLGKDRGRVLLEAFRQQGEVLLAELTGLCTTRKSLLEKGLAGIEAEIAANEKRRSEATERQEAIINRANVEVTEGFRRFRVRTGDEIGKRTGDSLLVRFGAQNEFCLSKDDKTEGKSALDALNNEIALEYRAFAATVEKQVGEAQRRTREAVGSTSLFAKLSAERKWAPVTLKALVPAASLEWKASLLITVAAGLCGGFLVRTVFGFFNTVTITQFLMGFGGGVAVRFVLYRKVLGLTGWLASFLAKFKGKPIKEVLGPRLAGELRARLDEIDRDTVIPLGVKLRAEVARSFTEYFDFIARTLAGLKAKKETGKERYELGRYQKVLEDLAAAGARLRQFFPAAAGDAEAKREGLWGKLKGLLG